jgi:hypothetical protein
LENIKRIFRMRQLGEGFSRCDNLENIKRIFRMRKLGEEGFSGCDTWRTLEGFSGGDNLEKIKGFSGCDNLENIRRIFRMRQLGEHNDFPDGTTWRR